MKTHIDHDRCSGYASCVMAAMDLFDIDDDSGQAFVKRQPDESERTKAEKAVRDCPTDAISITED